MRKLLLVSIFCAAFSGVGAQFPDQKCDSLKVDHKLTLNSNEKWDLEITAQGEGLPFKYILCDGNGTPIGNDFDKTSFTNLTSGDYWIIVATSKGCHEKIKISAK